MRAAKRATVPHNQRRIIRSKEAGLLVETHLDHRRTSYVSMAAVASALAGTIVALGWSVGYRSLVSYIAFCTLSAFACATAFRITRAVYRSTGIADTMLRCGVIAFALIALAGLTLGSLGALGVAPYLLFFGACFAASLFVEHAASASSPEGPRDASALSPAQLIAIVAPILAFVVAVGITRSPFTLYDSVSYHLLFPARWLQDHRLSIVPTPFSDEAQAYAPANGELFFLWLMLPFHGDVVARVGQIPFYLLCGVALYALARRIGARPAHAIWAPAFLFFARPIVEQAVGADVDLICWAMLLASLYFGLVALESDARRDWLLFGVSLGLYWGSKYVALVYTPILVALALMRGPRRRMVWALPGILLFAMPWYVRNWVIAGSPIYPASLGFAGLTVAQGAYTRAAMMSSVFHTTDPRLLPVIVSHAFGINFFLFWIPFAVAGAWSMAAARPRWPAAFLVCTPIVMVLLFWIGVPDNVDSRFLLPSAIVGTLPLAFVFRTNRTWNACVHGLYAAGLAWMVVGLHRELPVDLPWFMGGWLSLDGLVATPFVPLFAALVVLASCGGYLVSRNAARALPVLTVAFGIVCTVLAVGSETWCRPNRCEFFRLSSPYFRQTMVEGWRWVRANVERSTIANTGNNVPYPLFGDRLTNRVYYVNIDRHLDWRFHDYDRAHRRHGPEAPVSPQLANSSGVLTPLPGPPRWRADAVRPRYPRMEGNRDAWIGNLKARGVDYLFISALSAYEIDYVTHNSGNFPIEDDWARHDPEAFVLVYSNPQVRVYAVHVR